MKKYFLPLTALVCVLVLVTTIFSGIVPMNLKKGMNLNYSLAALGPPPDILEFLQQIFQRILQILQAIFGNLF